jgi:hypothetical protein
MFFSPTYPNDLYPIYLSPGNPLKKGLSDIPNSSTICYRVFKAKDPIGGFAERAFASKTGSKCPYFKTVNLQIDFAPEGVLTTR